MRKVKEDMNQVWKKKVQVEDTECRDVTKRIIIIFVIMKSCKKIGESDFVYKESRKSNNNEEFEAFNQLRNIADSKTTIERSVMPLQE